MMTNSLTINIQLLKEEEVSVIEFLYLYSLYSGEEFGIDFKTVDVNKLQEKKLLKISSKNEKILRQHSIDLIEFSLIETDISLKQKKKEVAKSSRAINNQVTTFVDEFRLKWHGLKPGAMGSRAACIQKLKKWMKENPEVTPESILAAVDLYISTEGRDPRFLQRADYFIYKQDSARNEASRLSAYVDEIILGTTNDDWTSQLN